MPGFKVQDLGAGANASPRPFYKYTWDIESVLGMVASLPPLIYVKDATLPSWDIDKEMVQGASLQYKFAKSIVFNDVKLSWYDTDGLEEKMRAWRGMVWSPETGLADPNVYKTNTTLNSYSFDLQKKVAHLLINSWPQSIKSGDLTYTDSEFKVVEVTIAYDWSVSA